MKGNLMKGRLFLLDLPLFFTTRINPSISRTYLLSLFKLTIDPLNISAISSRNGANHPSV